MSDILHKASVLVLNRNWQAINVRTPQEAFCQMATDVATGLDISPEGMIPVKWVDWFNLEIRESDNVIHTAKQAIRVPTVIVLSNFSKVPKKRPRLCAKTLWERDKGICQYTGRQLDRSEANIDHILPRSKGGGTTWENCVIADKKVNSKKADRLPQEVGLKLLKTPVAPREVPVSSMIRNHLSIPDWNYFL